MVTVTQSADLSIVEYDREITLYRNIEKYNALKEGNILKHYKK